jgi:hypothetical protein
MAALLSASTPLPSRLLSIPLDEKGVDFFALQQVTAAASIARQSPVAFAARSSARLQLRHDPPQSDRGYPPRYLFSRTNSDLVCSLPTEVSRGNGAFNFAGRRFVQLCPPHRSNSRPAESRQSLRASILYLPRPAASLPPPSSVKALFYRSPVEESRDDAALTAIGRMYSWNWRTGGIAYISRRVGCAPSRRHDLQTVEILLARPRPLSSNLGITVHVIEMPIATLRQKELSACSVPSEALEAILAASDITKGRPAPLFPVLPIPCDISENPVCGGSPDLILLC